MTDNHSNITTKHTMNENDFESPGYEYLRSYQNMSHLYYKLVALQYKRDFCALYKCPPIHRYYFSVPSHNPAEQKFLFTSLCAWLIKDKCQMNLELEPEEYEDEDVVVGVIYEALRLLLTSDEPPSDQQSRAKRSQRVNSNVNFPPARLKSGFGPEVVWTMNVLADRALELRLTSEPPIEASKIKVIYNNNNSSRNSAPDINKSVPSASYITIGQPHVGGGLTTRPLGNYQIDDASLLFDDGEQPLQLPSMDDENHDEFTLIQSDVDPIEWYPQVTRGMSTLESAKSAIENELPKSWKDFSQSASGARKFVNDFLINSKPILEAICKRIDRQMQVLTSRERFLQTNLKTDIDEFLKVWRIYSVESARNSKLIEQVNERTDKFEICNAELSDINSQIDLRIKELNDGSKLKELEDLIARLKEENADFDLKIGLLLTVYSKVHAEIISSTIEP